MKKTILYIFLNLIFYSTLFSQINWTDINYHFQTGSVPPPYYHSFDIHLSRNGDGTLGYHCIYTDDSSWTYYIILQKANIDKLDSAINNCDVLNDSIPVLKKYPIGGSTQHLQIFLKQDPNLDQPPKSITTPDFPLPEYKEKLESLYEAIRSSIPQTIWDDINSRKENLKNNK